MLVPRKDGYYRDCLLRVHTPRNTDTSFSYQSHKWVTMQLAGTMDIDCSKYMDWFHGGLQFQTEHHLVPRMPRHKLRKFREEVVKPFLKAHGLQHDQPSFWQANVEVWRTLKQCAAAAKLSPAFAHAVNLQG